MYAGIKYCIRCGKPLYGLFDTDMCVDCSKTLVTATDHTEQVSYESLYIPKSVIEDIRAEIASYKSDRLIDVERNEMIDIVLEIIDKHLKAVGE